MKLIYLLVSLLLLGSQAAFANKANIEKTWAKMEGCKYGSKNWSLRRKFSDQSQWGVLKDWKSDWVVKHVSKLDVESPLNRTLLRCSYFIINFYNQIMVHFFSQYHSYDFIGFLTITTLQH